MNSYPQAMQAPAAMQQPGYPVPPRAPKAMSKSAPVALWVVGAVALLLGATAWFVPLGSSSGGYGFRLECPTAAESVRGVAKMAELSRNSNFTARAAQSVAEECPQTAVALGVGVIATIGGVVMLATAFIITVARANAGPSSRPTRPWVAPGPNLGATPQRYGA